MISKYIARVKKARITNRQVENFASLLTGWSLEEHSFFLREFFKSICMTEMQFYRRVWMAEHLVFDFDIEDIKLNLKRNRNMRTLGKKYVKVRQKRAETIEFPKEVYVNFKKDESFIDKIKKDEKEARRK